MVKEKKIVFTPIDISRIRICCRHCGTEVVQKLDDYSKIPSHCPRSRCAKEWHVERSHVQPIAEATLIEALRELANNQRCSPLKIAFEIDAGSGSG